MVYSLIQCSSFEVYGAFLVTRWGMNGSSCCWVLRFFWCHVGASIGTIVR